MRRRIVLILICVSVIARAQWTQTNLPSGYDRFTWCFAMDRGTLLAGTTCGVYVSTNNGEKWRPQSLVDTNVTHLAVVPQSERRDASTILAGARVVNNNPALEPLGVLRSRTNGESWERVNTGLVVQALAVGVDGSESGLGTVFLTNGKGVYRSTDEGETWSLPGTRGDTTIGQLVVLPPPSAGSYPTVFATCGKPMPPFPGVSLGVYRSTDGGGTWTEVNKGLTDTRIRGFAAWGRDLFAVDDESRIFLTSDYGEHWMRWGAGSPPPGVCSIAVKDTNVFVASGGEVFCQTPHGSRWVSVSDGVPYGAIITAGIYAGFLVVSTSENGTWRRPLSQIAVGVSNDGVVVRPRDSRLEQNYPNPFNPTTLIRYVIPGCESQASPLSDVKLVVFDILGREVATLVNEREEPGAYAVQFDARGLPSGPYFYRIQSTSFIATRRMMLVR